MEVIVATLSALALVWFLQRCYAPVILEAVQQMPEGALLRDGVLTNVPETLLSETKLIAIAVTPDEETDIGQSADVQIQFRQSNFRVGSVFWPNWGLQFDYGSGKTDVGRTTLEPVWGAWHPVIFAGCGVAMITWLAASWAALAFLYSVPAKIAAWFGDRKLSWTGAWKLSSASLMPGAVVIVAGIILYGREAVDLIGFGCFFAAHFVVGWVYVGGGVFFLDKTKTAAVNNPFKPGA